MGTYRATLEIYDAATGEVILTLRTGGLIQHLVWSPDGKQLAASSEGTIRVWDSVSGKVTFTMSTAVSDRTGWKYPAMAWSPDSSSLAWVNYLPGKDTTTWIKELRLWDVAQDKSTLLRLERGKRVVRGPSLGWSPAGRWLATVRNDGVLEVWDTAVGKDVLALPSALSPDGNGSVASVWSPDGGRLAFITTDGTTIKVVDPATGKESLCVRCQTDSWVANRRPGYGVHCVLAWSPDGKRLASAIASMSNKGFVWEAEGKVWDASTGKDLLTLHLDSGVGQLMWSADGRQLVANSRDTRRMTVWDTTTGKTTGKEIPFPTPAKGSWSWLLWEPRGRHLAVGNSGTVQICDAVSAAKKALGPSLPFLCRFPQDHRLVAWAPEGRRLAVVSPDWTVKIWDAGLGKETISLGRSPRQTNALRGPYNIAPENRVVLAWSPDGEWLASSASLDRTIQVWNPATGAKRRTLPGHPKEIRSLAWSRDGQRLASAGDDGSVKVWDVATGEKVLSLGYSPQRDQSSRTAQGLSLLAWSRDCEQLAVAGADGTVTVWTIPTGKEVVTLYGPKGPVFAVAWSPDGRRLAAASGDSNIVLWDPLVAQEVLTLHYTPPSVTLWRSLAWSLDGRRLALATAEMSKGSVTIWEAAPQADAPEPAQHRPEK